MTISHRPFRGRLTNAMAALLASGLICFGTLLLVFIEGRFYSPNCLFSCNIDCLHSIIQWSRIRAYCALLYRIIVDIAGTERKIVRLFIPGVTLEHWNCSLGTEPAHLAPTISHRTSIDGATYSGQIAVELGKWITPPVK
jgi:hypothetical protein